MQARHLAPLGKKLIEYGWDVPTPAEMRDGFAAMEKRPFDGLIFRLSGGHNAFVTKPLDAVNFAEDERILRNLQFTRFRDNFVLVWGSPPADFDWFNDIQWDAIEANAKLLVGIPQAGRIRGICFDPEPVRSKCPCGLSVIEPQQPSQAFTRADLARRLANSVSLRGE